MGTTVQSEQMLRALSLVPYTPVEQALRWGGGRTLARLLSAGWVQRHPEWTG